ncbi:hypothetical protein, partial [Nonomuraea sp. NPDC049695]|uniref:hypothetical protein n=1 Tax=Nonomuraea sp. NPDC049695 TaxID=3154734 RepID=UPI003420F4C8
QKVVGSARQRNNLRLLLDALMPSARLQQVLSRYAEAAATYREAGDVAATLADPHAVATCRASEALSLHRTGDLQRALAVLAQAQAATGALPGRPPNRLARTCAIVFRSAAHVLSAAGRLQEATDHAARAAAAFRQVGDATEAAEMDLLYARTRTLNQL